MKIMNSMRDLAWTLGVPLERLKRIADSPAENYHEFTHWKDAAKTQARKIRNPRDELKKIQRLLKDRVFDTRGFSSAVQGGIEGRSPKTNAEQHVGAHLLVTMDVKRFYDSVGHKVVFRVLREEGFGTEVARLIAKLTTRNGLLPQGAPTSGVIANLVLSRALDEPLEQKTGANGEIYTRYVDDIALSGDRPAVYVSGIAKCLSSRGLSIHRGDKLAIRSRSKPQKITGLNINSGRPTIPRHYREDVRSAIHKVGALSDAVQRRKAARKIQGRIAYIRQFHPAPAHKLDKLLKAVLDDRVRP